MTPTEPTKPMLRLVNHARFLASLAGAYYHYRLFLAPDWRTPLLPRGEVYDREFIEMGWRSWSEQHGVPGIGDDRPP